MASGYTVEAKKSITIGEIMTAQKKLKKEYPFAELCVTLESGVPTLEIVEE